MPGGYSLSTTELSPTTGADPREDPPPGCIRLRSFGLVTPGRRGLLDRSLARIGQSRSERERAALELDIPGIRSVLQEPLRILDVSSVAKLQRCHTLTTVTARARNGGIQRNVTGILNFLAELSTNLRYGRDSYCQHHRQHRCQQYQLPQFVPPPTIGSHNHLHSFTNNFTCQR